MEAIFAVFIIFAVTGVVAFRIHQQRELKKKGELYNTLLKEARATRFQFIQAAQQTRDAAKEVERIEENLASIKAELLGYLKEFRVLIIQMRAQISKSTDTDLDIRTIGQMKLTFTEKWSFADSRKKHCLELRSELAISRANLRQLENVENQITDIWKEQKDRVLAFYIELKDQLAISDPKKFFN